MRMRYTGIKVIATEGEPVRKEITANFGFEDGLRQTIAECLGIPIERIPLLRIRQHLLMAYLSLTYGRKKTKLELYCMYYRWKDNEEKLSQIVKELIELRRSFYFIYGTYVKETKGKFTDISYRYLKIDVMFNKDSSNNNNNNNNVTVTVSLLRDYKGKAAGWIYL